MATASSSQQPATHQAHLTWSSRCAGAMEAARVGPGGRSVSARGLARSVAHRLKYYIDVQRKEDSFDSSAVPCDEAEILNLHPSYLTEQKKSDMLEHNFAQIKLEASLRAYMGDAKECYRKVQKSPEEQKDVENLIKKMARNYIPDRRNEGKAKSTKRQKKTQRTSNLHKTASPSMSPEEVQRLVSSASKLIVAATSKKPSEGSVSSPVNKEMEGYHSLENTCRLCWSFAYSQKDEAKRIKQKYSQDRKRSRTPNISSNLKTKPKGKTPVTISPVVIPLQTTPDKAFRKGILKSGNTPSCNSAASPDYQDAKADTKCKNFSPARQNAENSVISQQLFKPEMQDAACRIIEVVPNSKSCLTSGFSGAPRIRSMNDHCREKGKIPKHSTRSTAEAIDRQVWAGKRTRKQERSARSPGSFFEAQINPTDALCSWNSKPIEDAGKDWSQGAEQDGHDVEARSIPVCHQIRWPAVHQGDILSTTACEQPASKTFNSHGLRGSEDRSQTSGNINTASGIAEGLEGGQSSDDVPVYRHGASFLYRVCQEMDRDTPISLTSDSSTTTGSKRGNQSTSPGLDQLCSNGPTVEHPTGHMMEKTSASGDTCDHPATGAKSVRPRESTLWRDSICEASEEQNSGSSALAKAILEGSEEEQSEEEFTISSASSSFSARSLISLHKQMRRGAEKQSKTNSLREPLVHKVAMPEENSVGQAMPHQYSQKPSPHTEERADMDHGRHRISTGQIVYFSHFPKLF